MENALLTKHVLAVQGADRQLRVDPRLCPHASLVPSYVRRAAGTNFVFIMIEICSDCHLIDPFNHGPIVPEKGRE